MEGLVDAVTFQVIQEFEVKINRADYRSSASETIRAVHLEDWQAYKQM